MGRLRIRDRAVQDIDEIATFIAQRNLQAGVRFYDAALEAFELLRAFPGAGPVVEPPVAATPDLHFWPIRRYRNYLVLYRKLGDGVEIIRVVYGGRQLNELLREG